MNPRQLTSVIAEVSLIAASVVATIALERLFADLTFLSDLLVMVVASHLVAVACRRARFKIGLSALVGAITLILLGSAVFYPSDSWFIVPTSDTIRALTDDLSVAGTVFVEDSAPVEPLRGFVVSASVLLWLGAFLADSAAFRLRSSFEAIAFPTLVLAFSALVGVDHNQLAHGAAYTAAVTAFLLSMRALSRADDSVWLANRAGQGVSTILRSGAFFGLVVVLAGVFAAPRIPGAYSQPLLDITELDDPAPTRNIVSPLVNVSASLVEQSDDEIFSVRVAQDERDYWRLMALTTFDGNQWKRTSQFNEAYGPLPSTVDIDNRKLLTQTVTKRSQGVDDIYLPAAYELSRVLDDGGVNLEYEVDTGALVYQKNSQELAEQGFQYTIESLVPDYDPSRLPERASAGSSREFLGEHTQLPPTCGPGQSTTTHDCWPERISLLAQQVTSGAATDYQRARMLQDYFRDPANFTYDINVARRHDVASAEDFLFNVRVGYCEQFASVFTAMARSLGIPARMAVGYTWGSWDPARQEYVVRGHHAHAWPEVYFSGIGWIIFEPTPGRSRPQDSDITGHTVARQYPSNRLPPSPDSSPETADQGVEGAGSGVQAPSAPRPSVPEASSRENPVSDSGVLAVSSSVARLILMVGATIAALVALAPAANAIRRRRRLLRAAADPVLRGEIAWDDALRALRLLGSSPERNQTLMEFASETTRLRSGVGPLEDLAASVTALRYSESSHRESRDLAEPQQHGAMNQTALRAEGASAQIVDQCHTLAGRRRVALSTIDPRTLVER